METRVLEHVSWGDWVLRDRGIYILDEAATPEPTISLFGLTTQRLERLQTLEKWPHVAIPPAFDVSRDGRTFLYGRVDDIDNDIMLVDNFQ